MDLNKKSYEVSLWKDQLIWHRRKLDKITINSNTYEIGKYYSQKDSLGEPIYELDYEEYDETKDYYILKPLDAAQKNFKEGSIEEIKIAESESEEWNCPQIITSFYKESCLCTIGSNTMTSLSRCINPKLITKINGDNTFIFTMYYRYIDTETGELVYNPFVKYLTNERKIKVRVGEKDQEPEWYDFIIKQVQENSETKAFIYTCKDQFVNELSKTGFDIILDNELENNIGAVQELATTILDGSDWKVSTSDSLMQFIEEPLYKIKVSSNFNMPIKVMNPIKESSENNVPEQLDIKGKYIYVFYSNINDQNSFLQFLFPDENGTFKTNDKLVIDKDKYPNYLLENVTYTAPDKNGNIWPSFTHITQSGNYDAVITSSYRGMRLVRQIQTKYDSTIDKFVQVYQRKKEGQENEFEDQLYYGFTQTEFISPNAVNNYIINPNTFTNTTGWYTEKTEKQEGEEQTARPILDLVIDPPVTNGNLNTEFTSYLKFPSNGTKLMNTSIGGFRSTIQEFVEEATKFILRIKYKKEDTSDDNSNEGRIPENFENKVPKKVELGKYDLISDHYHIIQKIIEFEEMEFPITNEKEQDKDFLYMIGTSSVSISKTDFKNWENKFGLFITFEEGTIESPINYFIADIQLFPYLEYKDNQNEGKICVPGGEIFTEPKIIYNYYLPNPNYSSIEDIHFVSKSVNKEDPKFVPYYSDGEYTKKATITAKESNCFNLLQDLNEKFQCWMRFNIKRKENGTIKLGKDLGILTGDDAYRQQKFVSFHEYAGQKKYIGFRYGLNSKSIQRTLDSNSTISKMIVKDNANEFAKNGFCSIARASENPTKENFLLNFDQYIQFNLLDLDVVTNDLYLDINGYLGYYKKLKNFNNNRDADIELQAQLIKDISNYSASYQTYKLSADAATEERLTTEENIVKLIVPEGVEPYPSFEAAISNPEITDPWKENDKFIAYTTKWAQCKNTERVHGAMAATANEYLQQAEEQFKTVTERLEVLANKKRALNLQFYKKYSRFIQEGSWIKEDYTDDNLYYFDSVSTLHASSQPKVSYNINVIDISQLLGYEAYDFNLGDITYIEDTEFFGWSLQNRKNPYREEIIVAEITRELDSPEKNIIKVQNYKTQFEDLFQRITAQTQQAEYHTGEFKRAANAIEPNGTISTSSLESVFANNSLKLQNAKDQSVIIDENGITTTSLANPSEMVRIIAGGIFMSTDGGQSWRTGVTGGGINTAYLTAGQINADQIVIMNGGQPSFRWDNKGINAYTKQGDAYNLGKYVRFDQYGIYGIIKDSEWEPKNIEEVHDNAKFALTWKGFSLKNDDGSISITSIDDIQVLDNQSRERIKIGRLNKTDSNENQAINYGIRISRPQNSSTELENTMIPVLETDINGALWLRDKLSIGTEATSMVKIGYLDEVRGSTKYHEVIHAGESEKEGQVPFIVYEDGHVIANYIDIVGGKIGGLEIESMDGGYQVSITASNGTTFKDGRGEKILTATLYYNAWMISEEKVEYQWYFDGKIIPNETNKTLTVKWNPAEGKDYMTYSCTCKLKSLED